MAEQRHKFRYCKFIIKSDYINHSLALFQVLTHLVGENSALSGLGKPCPLIFHQQPGLIPFKTSKLGSSNSSKVMSRESSTVSMIQQAWPSWLPCAKEHARKMCPEITLNRIFHCHIQRLATDDPVSPEDRRLYPRLLSKWWTQHLQWQFHGLCSRAWTTPTAS